MNKALEDEGVWVGLHGEEMLERWVDDKWEEVLVKPKAESCLAANGCQSHSEVRLVRS